MAVNIHITIIELNALHTKRQNLFQELDAVIHLLMEAKHWGLRNRWITASSSWKRFCLFQELDAVIHLLMEAKHWGLRKSRNATSLNSRWITASSSSVQQECRDRKSGSAGMPRPISYAVFCLKKKK